MSGAISAGRQSSFARNNDFFFYKRFRDVAEFTDASSLGAFLSLCGGATMAILFVLELVAFLTVSARQELVLAPHSADPVRYGTHGDQLTGIRISRCHPLPAADNHLFQRDVPDAAMRPSHP